MRVIAHRGPRDIDVGWDVLAAYRRVVIDIGTGDGRFVVRRATAHPDWLVVGVDANAAGLCDGFRRAARARLSNAVFVVASAEALPQELTGWAHEVRIQFPWGSLLTSVVRPEAEILLGVARLLRPGATLTILLSVIERDGVEGLSVLDQRAAAQAARRIAGACDDLVLDDYRVATPADVAAAHSTWGKRLGVGHSRQGWVLRFRAAEPA